MKYKSLLVVYCCLLLILGCKKDDITEPLVPNTDLYPIAIGNKLEYNEYEIDATGKKVTGTDVKTVRTVVSKLNLFNAEAYMVIDETSMNNSVISKDTSFINKTSNGDVRYFIALEQELMPGVKVSVADWFTFYKPSENVGSEYTVFKKDTLLRKIQLLGMTIDSALISINVTGKKLAPENVTVPAFTSSVSAGRVDINMKVVAAGIPVLDGLFFQQWLYEGTGPIKEISPVVSGRKGYYRELSKKNF
jgi:hypothetical protein